MQVNSIRSYSAPRVAFGNEGEAAEKKQVNKKALVAAGAGAAAAAAVGTAAYALHRGKVVKGKDAKLLETLKEGFKSFVGEGRKNYLEKVKANLQDMINNGKKAKDGTFTKLTKEAADNTQNKIGKIDKKINKISEKIAKKAEKAAPEVAKATEEAAQAAEQVIQ